MCTEASCVQEGFMSTGRFYVDTMLMCTRCFMCKGRFMHGITSLHHGTRYETNAQRKRVMGLGEMPPDG